MKVRLPLRPLVILLLCCGLLGTSLPAAPIGAHVVAAENAGADSMDSVASTQAQLNTEDAMAEDLPSAADADLAKAEARSWLQPFEAPVVSAGAQSIEITENGFAPAALAVFGPTDVTWVNTTSISLTLKSGVPPETAWMIYLPTIRTSGSGQSGRSHALAQARHQLMRTTEDSYQASLGPGQSYSRRFNAPGEYHFHLAESGAAGTVVLTGTTLLDSSPSNGEDGVSSTRESILTFSGPLMEDTVTADAFIARFGSQDLPFRINLSPDRTRVTLFYQNPLPGNARVQLAIDGNKLQDAAGMAVDVDGDSVAGGVKTLRFDTLSLTVVPGTSVCGRVFASEVGESGSGVSINTPLQGATITVDGLESTLRTTTDANGNFCLDPAPAGRFFVHIDGRTASNGVPAGAYYPYVGKAWASVIGQQTDVGDVYLPLVAPGTLQPVSESEDTVITFAEQVVAGHPEFAGVSILVPAGSLYSDDGTRGGQVGIAPVPPDRLPGELPEGLEFPVVITVQTDGATNFDVPAPVCFPNLPNQQTGQKLAAGSKSALWSFNHDTGRFEIVGPMTVSGDGRMVCTDPGVGVRAPGWHGTQPGASGVGGPIADSCTNDATSTKFVFKSSDLTVSSSFESRMCPLIQGRTFAGWVEYSPEVSCCATNGTGVVPRDPIADINACLGRIPKPSNNPLTNGCGSQSGVTSIFPIPDCWTFDDPLYGKGEVCFTPACNAHDQCYGTCNGDPGHKYSCDRKFLTDMERICESTFPDPMFSLREQCKERAAPYFAGVAEFGGEGYLGGQSAACSCCPPVEPTPIPPANCPSPGSTRQIQASTTSPSQLLFDDKTFPVQSRELKLTTGLHYYVLRNWFTGEIVQRGTINSSGYAFDNLVLKANTLYRLYILHAATLQNGYVNFTTLGSGSRLGLPTTILQPDMDRDTDVDGLSDDGEYIVGTDANKSDTDNDGISDGTEIQQGTNPLDGLPVQTGIIATADTLGLAQDLCIMNDLAVAADGETGVTLFAVPPGRAPTAIAQVDTPGGAQAVACAEDWVAVADGAAGLAIVDASNPAAIAIAQQVDVGSLAQAVAVADGIAFMGTAAGEVVAVDLASGAVLSRANVGTAVEDVAVAGDSLFALTRQTLHTFASLGMPLTLSASVASPSTISGGRRGRLFVGGGIAYASHPQGYNTFDVSNPAHPLLLANGVTEQFGWKQIVTNGSGLGIAAVSPNSTDDGPHHISLYDVSAVAQTGVFLTQFETPGLAAAVTLYNGQAYVADSEAGLQVINYRSFESQGSAPTIELVSNFAPGRAEAQALMRLTANTSDDVQVRNVTFYIDQQPVFTDGNYPFEYHFRTSALAQQSSFLVRARATDTGGHETWTNEQVVQLVADATPPHVTAFSPESFAAPGALSTLSARFNEDLDTATVNADTFQLFAAGLDGLLGTADDQPVAGTVAYAAATRTASLALEAPLSEGRYRAVLKAAITDAAGNGLLNGDFDWRFAVGLTIWDGGGDGASWHDAANWEEDRLPVDGAIVVIEGAGSGSVIYRQGELAIGSLHSTLPLHIAGGTLTVNGPVTLGDLTLTGGTFATNQEMEITGAFIWNNGTMSGIGKKVIQGEAEIMNSAVLNEGTLENHGTVTWKSGDIHLHDGATIHNLSDASFADQRTQQERSILHDNSGPLEGFINEGTFTKSGTPTTKVNVTFDNRGTLAVQNGTLRLFGGGTSSGSAEVGSGGLLRLDSNYIFDDSSSVSGGGEIFISSGSVTFNGLYSVSGTTRVTGGTASFNPSNGLVFPSLALAGGTLTSSQAMTITGAFIWNGGSLGGSGRRVTTGGVEIMNSAVLNEGTLENSGTVTWKSGDIHLHNGATIHNLSGASFIDQQSNQNAHRILHDDNGEIEDFINEGTFIKSGGSFTDVNVTFDNRGTVAAQQGTWRLFGGGNNSGTIDIGGGTTMAVSDSYVNETSGVIQGNGTLDISGATFTNNGTIAPTVIVVN